MREVLTIAAALAIIGGLLPAVLYVQRATGGNLARIGPAQLLMGAIPGIAAAAVVVLLLVDFDFVPDETERVMVALVAGAISLALAALLLRRRL